jgi:hypothetical protein
MQQSSKGQWQQALKEAIAGTGRHSARSTIQSAEFAIFNRIRGYVPGPNAVEDQALFDALSTIRDLKAREDLLRT